VVILGGAAGPGHQQGRDKGRAGQDQGQDQDRATSSGAAGPGQGQSRGKIKGKIRTGPPAEQDKIRAGPPAAAQQGRPGAGAWPGQELGPGQGQGQALPLHYTLLTRIQPGLILERGPGGAVRRRLALFLTRCEPPKVARRTKKMMRPRTIRAIYKDDTLCYTSGRASSLAGNQSKAVAFYIPARTKPDGLRA